MRPAALLATCLALLASVAAAGPLRVLYLDPAGAEQSKVGPLHGLMEGLGRDAVWFDYQPGPTSGAPLPAYDAVAVGPSAPAGDAPAILARLPASLPVLQVPEGADPAAFLADLLGRLPQPRVKAWREFLAAREPEQREPSPWVANYERRPQPITFQKPLAPKGSMERTHVPADLRLTLFAAEPDILKPIAFAWDERGRLWVAETRDYPHGVAKDGLGNDSIRICEDTDGDGRADKFTLFADRLNIPTSLVFARGGILVSQPPSLLFLRDSDGDDRADIREVVMGGWGIGDTHAQASSLSWGFDNWVRGAVGYSGFKGKVGDRELAFSQGTYRLRPDGSAMEFLHQFTNNTWGQSANAVGDAFGGTANGAPLFFGGIPHCALPPGMRAATARKVNRVDKAHAVTPNYRQVDVMGGYTSAAGSNFLHSAVLPARYQGMAMVCEPTMKIVALVDARAEGAGYAGLDGFNLLASTDEWLSPVFADVGPDGAVWVADFQNFIIQHNPTPTPDRGGFKGTTGVGGAHENPLRDHARGRIYRIVPASRPDLPAHVAQKDDPASLVAGLGGPTLTGRLRAQRMLVERGVVAAAPALRELVRKPRPADPRGDNREIHALWALHGLGQLDAETHRIALAQPANPDLRRNAVRAVAAGPGALNLLGASGVLADTAPAVRLACLVKLAELEPAPELEAIARSALAESLAQPDPWLKDAARLLARRQGVLAQRLGPNLLANAGFEEAGPDRLPAGWSRRDYNGNESTRAARWERVEDPALARSGRHALRCVVKPGGPPADTSLHLDADLRPDTDYRLSGWVRARGVRGKVSLNDHIGRAETDTVQRDAGWTEVEVTFNSGRRPRSSVNVLFVGSGEAHWDDVRLSEILPAEDPPVAAGDPRRGETLVRSHPAAACLNCHMIGGKGSAIGPALDGVGGRLTAAQIRESLLEPGKVLAKGYEALGVSPMPPMGLLLKPQEVADVEAFLATLR